MNTKIKSTTKTLSAIILSVLVSFSITQAIGSLTPSGTAGDDTQYTLNDIYDKLTDFSDTPTATSSPFAVPGTVTESFATLTEIYDLLAAEEDDLVAGNIANGVTIFGVVGTSEADPVLTWQDDPGLALCWSGAQFEIDNFCTSGNGGFTNEGYGAVEYCANLDEDGHTDWRLPTAREYNSIVDFATNTPATLVSGFSLGEDYWTSTISDSNSEAAWYWSVNAGYIDTDTRYYSNYRVRCVR